MSLYAFNNDLIAVEYADGYSMEILQNSYEYILRRTKRADNGQNWHYDYDLVHGNIIKSGSWMISRIYTVSAWKPREIVFSIVDPSLMNDREVGVVHQTPRAKQNYIAFPELTLKSLNKGLDFFGKLSSYKNFYHFLLSDEAGDYSTGQIANLRKMEDERKELKDKLTKINEIIGK